MRESWTDDRLDDLNGKVDALRVEMKSEFAAVRGEMDRRFDKIDRRFEKVDERFQGMDARLLGIHRTMVIFCGAAIAALIGVIGALVAVAVQL